MAALVTVARNGTVSILRGLSISEAEQARDVALDVARRKMHEIALREALHEHRTRFCRAGEVAKLFFLGNTSNSDRLDLPDGTFFRDGSSYDRGFAYARYPETAGDIVRAEIIGASDLEFQEESAAEHAA